jgi:hypothetical protein
MRLLVDVRGQVHCLYAEAIDLSALGELSIRRASHVEPDRHGRWWADLAIIGGPKLGPFGRRSEALQAEAGWIDGYLFQLAPASRPTNPLATDPAGPEQK